MHNLPLQLLLAALILVGGAHCCNYERMTNVPSYKDITTPKKVLDVSRPHGICVADNGIFAVTFYARNGFFHLYYECGALMKVVRLPPGHGRMTDCAFSGRDLVYLTDREEKKIYKYSTNGTLLKIIAAKAEHIIFITSCHNRLYATTESRRLVSYHNDKEVYRVTVPGSPRGVVVDQNNELRIVLSSNKVLTYSLMGKLLQETVYKGLGLGYGLAMDSASNTLVIDRKSPPRLLVYSPSGELIKNIQKAFRIPVDVEISNGGMIIVSDYRNNKVYLY